MAPAGRLEKAVVSEQEGGATHRARRRRRFRAELMPAYDVLIIGAGLAGQRAALAAAKAGACVGIVSKVHPVRSRSTAAAGVGSTPRGRGAGARHHERRAQRVRRPAAGARAR